MILLNNEKQKYYKNKCPIERRGSNQHLTPKEIIKLEKNFELKTRETFFGAFFFFFFC